MRSRRLGPVVRTLVLCTVGIVCGLVMVLTLALNLGETDAIAQEQVDRTLPSLDALRATRSAATSGQEEFLTAVQSQDPIARSTALAAAQADGQTQNSAWATYRDHALQRRGERALQADYTESADRSVKLAATLLGTSSDDPTFAQKLAEERSISTHTSEVLATLESRFYVPATHHAAVTIVSGIDHARNSLYYSYAVVALLFSAIGVWLMRGYRDDERRMATDAAEMKTEARYSKLETTLQRALEMEHTEEAAYDVIAQALTIVDPGVPSEMLLADSSQSHFRQVVSDPPGRGCRLPRRAHRTNVPRRRAARRSSSPGSSSLDTCPYLRGRSDTVWAACVPVGIAGRATGVLHMQRAVDIAPPDNGRGWELIARKAGDRLGMLRAFARSETQAHTDPLTGLLNRRSLETRTRALTDEGLPFVVAYADLDHFKLLNDVHGHDSGDRALRLFARILRDSVRPNDIPARYGGEEFVVVLPDCSVQDASAVIERVRQRLRQELEEGVIPQFTVSFGLAASSAGLSFGETVDAADQALLLAKREGRDRIIIASAAVRGRQQPRGHLATHLGALRTPARQRNRSRPARPPIAPLDSREVSRLFHHFAGSVTPT